MVSLPLLCLIAAGALSAYALIESRGRGILTWAVVLIAAALLWPFIR